MDYQYKLIVSNHTVYKEFEIPVDLERIKLGTTTNCEFRLNPDLFFESIEIELVKKSEWNILCSDNIYASKGDVRKLFYSELHHGDTFDICYLNSGEKAFEIRFLIDFGSERTVYNLQLDLSPIQELVIGASYGTDIELLTEYSKNTCIIIRQTFNGVCLIEKSSLCGTYVNGKRIDKSVFLNDYDFISVAEFSAFYIGKKLYFGKENIKLNRIENLVKQIDIGSNYPMFVRNTRAKSLVDDEKIKILDPDNIPAKPELNIVTSLMPPIVMLALIVVLRGIMSTSGGTYVIFSICSMGMAVITSILNIVNRQKKYENDCEKRRDIYLQYIENKRIEIEKSRQQELETLCDIYYSTEEDLEHIERFSSKLFDRVPEDEDFLDIYIGRGRRESQKQIDYKKQEKLEIGDDLCLIPKQMADNFKYIENAPIVLKIRKANAIGIIAEKNRQREFLKCILIDIVSRQYFGDVNVYVFIDNQIQEYDWLRMIPHIQANNNFRNIVCDNESKNVVFEYLYKELTYRREKKDVPGYNVVLLLNEHGIKSHPISRFIEHASELNTIFIFFEEDKRQLPLYCSQILVLNDKNSGYMYPSSNKSEKTYFNYSLIPEQRMMRAAEILAPVYCEEISLDNSLRKNISLYELLGIYSADDLNLKDRWNKSRIYETMAVPLGVNVKNEIVYLNLHEKYHGPHGLVAGTTGSGKSEILQTFILSAATYFHPYEIGFVIIDFKGGGMVNQFRELPHLLGAITNIDGNEVERSLKSIKAELIKRQNYFAQANVNHIDKYIQLYKDGKVKDALPHLLIIVDEFAELKAEQPEFMKELISTARIGRSLGVHLILATQKPSGVVDAQIWSNSRFKLCLKVQSKEDSNEVIKTPVAAEIKEPGRAYLQVGNNEIFELFQSAFSGAPAAFDTNEVGKEFVVSKVNFAGNRKVVYNRKATRKVGHIKNQLEAIVEFINEYCNREGIQKLSDICMPPLPKILNYSAYERVLSEDIYVAVGLLDNPEHQSQTVHYLNITAMNYILIGSTQTGKTNCLQTMIRSIADNYTPDEVNIYIIDFASMILKNFENLKHVGGVVLSYEDEKLKSLLRMLSKEVSNRKVRFAEVGVSSFSSFKEAGYTDFPQIVVMIDNLTVLKELYLQDNDMLLLLCREGNSVGITFIVANGQTAGIGYRYLNHFEGRIALFCNDSSEYNMLFEGSRMKLPCLPGRALIQVDKAVYESQMFIAFEGEKEYERVKDIQIYVSQCNKKYPNQKAKIISEIPKILDMKYVKEYFPNINEQEKIMLGLDYDSIEPVSVGIYDNNLIVLTGKKEDSRYAFARYLLDLFQQQIYGEVEFYIMDSMLGNWSEMEMLPETAFYSTDTNSSLSIISEIGQIVSERYMNLANHSLANLDSESWIIILVESYDAILSMSSDKTTMSIIRDLFGKYSEMKILFLFSNINNANIPFNAPEIMKIIKERKKYFVFDDIGNIKLTDIPLSVTRKYAKPIDAGDAYVIDENEIRKVRTVSKW